MLSSTVSPAETATPCFLDFMAIFFEHFDLPYAMLAILAPFNIAMLCSGVIHAGACGLLLHRQNYYAKPAETMLAFWLSLALGTGLLAFLYIFLCVSLTPVADFCDVLIFIAAAPSSLTFTEWVVLYCCACNQHSKKRFPSGIFRQEKHTKDNSMGNHIGVCNKLQNRSLCTSLCLAGHGGMPSKAKCTPPTWQQRIAFFGDLHGFTHPIATKSPDAQKLFDQARHKCDGIILIAISGPYNNSCC